MIGALYANWSRSGTIAPSLQQAKMMGLSIFFILFSIIAVLSALMVVFAPNPVKAVLSLVVTFVAVAGTWMLLQAEFLSLVLVVVYVGAVMVLFLFIVMMLDVERAKQKEGLVAYWPFALALAVLLCVCLINLTGHFALAASTNSLNFTDSNIRQIGLYLFTYDLYPFELAALVLLVAMVATISLTFRGRRTDTKTQIINQQLKASAKTRLKLLDIASTDNTAGGAEQ